LDTVVMETPSSPAMRFIVVVEAMSAVPNLWL
jgi:hypothetical protein